MSNSSSGGIGFIGVLTIVFVALKLLHVINWAWWWILSPVWISFGVALILMIIVIFIGVLVQLK